MPVKFVNPMTWALGTRPWGFWVYATTLTRSLTGSTNSRTANEDTLNRKPQTLLCLKIGFFKSGVQFLDPVTFLGR